MHDESISSPPFPGLATTTRGLYRDLIEMRAWLVSEQEQLKYVIKGKYAQRLEEPDNVASENIWEGIGVIDKYTVLSRMRQLREGWDAVLREHEDSWDSQLARRRRFDLFMLAHYILKVAFVSPELREAREQRQYKAYIKKQQLIQKKLNELFHTDSEEFSSDDEDDDTPKPEDDWFDDDHAA